MNCNLFLHFYFYFSRITVAILFSNFSELLLQVDPNSMAMNRANRNVRMFPCFFWPRDLKIIKMAAMDLNFKMAAMDPCERHLDKLFSSFVWNIMFFFNSEFYIMYWFILKTDTNDTFATFFQFWLSLHFVFHYEPLRTILSQLFFSFNWVCTLFFT